MSDDTIGAWMARVDERLAALEERLEAVHCEVLISAARSICAACRDGVEFDPATGSHPIRTRDGGVSQMCSAAPIHMLLRLL